MKNALIYGAAILLALLGLVLPALAPSEHANAALAVVLVLAASLPALAFPQHRAMLKRLGLQSPFNLRRLWSCEAGYTVTYCWPGGSTGQSTTAPTAVQASQVTMMTAAVAIGDAETFALFTHNWGLSASFPSFLFPVIQYRQSDFGTGPSTQLGNLTFNISNTNVITINKLAGVGNGGTFIVTLMRPHSLVR